MNHNLAYIHPDAVIGDNVVIEPFVNIHADVVIGDGTWIGANVTIMGGTRVGRDCKIFPGAVLGGVPQDLKYKGEETQLVVGDGVTIREYCTLNRGTSASFQTVIGAHSFLMAYVHVAHDCVIGQHCILANNVNLAGHITVGDYAILGGLVAVHQFVQIGAHVIVGGGSLVTKDIPPYVKAARTPLSYVGVNAIGLRRRGFSSPDIHAIQDIYRVLYVQGLNTSQALARLATLDIHPRYQAEIVAFVQQSERGIMKGFRSIYGNNRPTTE